MSKILIIEDEEMVLEMLSKKLSSEGYDVSGARDGEEGLKKIKELKPDLILLDIVMPKKGGFEVLEELNRDDVLKNIPVIIISNTGHSMEIAKAQDLGARDYLIKTQFEPLEAIEKIKKVLNKEN